ncbi:uncharacterized protein LY89DRAFT_718534 [Mollisia scopiformis]|uniref:Uncharacterized protein n=1 Tax=Mollisia scopiformis TaxID=149040 RepID=A0A194X9D3_MOLSC|nr:uncharacterized protein LY89DRAFT_718534 [Mollisia scopiformis]KUJ16780.1 hypothetical protein LY89DRAFT_718534 [Mollisia scopiformis]
MERNSVDLRSDGTGPYNDQSNPQLNNRDTMATVRDPDRPQIHHPSDLEGAIRLVENTLIRQKQDRVALCAHIASTQTTNSTVASTSTITTIATLSVLNAAQTMPGEIPKSAAVGPASSPRAHPNHAMQRRPIRHREFRSSHMLLQFRGQARRDESQLPLGPIILGISTPMDFFLKSTDFQLEGTVRALDVKAPTGGYTTFAFSLSFNTPEAALAFWNRANNGNVLLIGGNVVRVAADRVGVRRLDTIETRVLIIDGPSYLVNWPYLKAQFDDACYYNLDRWFMSQSPTPGMVRMEVRFARVVGQAQSCKQKCDWNPAHRNVLYT